MYRNLFLSTVFACALTLQAAAQQKLNEGEIPPTSHPTQQPAFSNVDFTLEEALAEMQKNAGKNAGNTDEEVYCGSIPRSGGLFGKRFSGNPRHFAPPSGLGGGTRFRVVDPTEESNVPPAASGQQQFTVYASPGEGNAQEKSVFGGGSVLTVDHHLHAGLQQAHSGANVEKKPKAAKAEDQLES